MIRVFKSVTILTIASSIIFARNINSLQTYNYHPDRIVIKTTNNNTDIFSVKELIGWISGDCNWYVSVVIEGLRYTSYQYEIRFTDEGSVDVNGIAVPFEVWNTDLDYSPSIYVQVANDQKYNFGIYEHFGENDSAIVWVVDISAPTDNPSIPPQSGDIYLVFITPPLTNEDVYQFTNKYISDIVEAPPLPIRFSLQQNYPNPFNPTTTISFSVTQNSDFVNLTIYNIKGQ
ncbi:MAG: hypothetical protein KAT54_04100, partial [Candidatus Marinimicrobia bacterium]|nr:hypothetical protein [Candidatus Neomarinimicrobiota bacterium]